MRYQVSETERVLVRGFLLLRLGRFDEALADFEWLLGNGRKELSPNDALARFQKAQALEGAGRVTEARAAYADFLEFWKTADRDLPIVVEALRAVARPPATSR